MIRNIDIKIKERIIKMKNRWFYPAGYDLIEYYLSHLTKEDFVEGNKNGISFLQWQENVANAIFSPIRNCSSPEETYTTILKHVKTFSKKYNIQNMFID